MFDKILIATDNSPLMEVAMRYTAKIFPYADYYLINVINTSDGSVPQTNLMQSRMRDISKKAIETGRDVLKDMGISDIKTTLPSGTPSKEIMKYISKNEIDLLVIATHSKEGAQKVHIGDTAIHSLQVTDIPALIFSCECMATIPNSIFNPTSFSSYSIEGTMLALDLASYFGASLTTYHIGKKDPGASARRIKKRAEEEDIDFELKIEKNASEEELLEESRKYNFIIGSRGRGGFLYKLRYFFPQLALSRLEKILIAESESPFLMVGD